MAKHKFIIFQLLFLWSLFSMTAFSQSFRIEAPSNVEVGNPFRVAFELKNISQNQFTAPSFNGLKVLGTAQDQSTYITISNGKQQSQSIRTITYILLAEKKGTYTIGSASVNTGKKVLKTSPWKITASGSGSSQGANSSSSRSSNQNVETSTESLPSVGNKNIFVRLNLSKTKVYKQQGILATFKLYVDPDIGLKQIQDVKFPDYNGFVAQEVDLDSNQTFKLENIGGRPYRTAILRQWVLLPQTPGKVTVPSASVDLNIAVRRKFKSTGDPFEDIFIQTTRGSAVYLDKHLVTPVQTIDVQELPEPQPTGFTGAVGKYSISAEISPKEPKTGESMTIKVKIGGSGNLKLLPNPKLKLPESFDVFDPKSTSSINVTPSGASGVKTIEYYAVPNEVGKATIPPIELVYFDTDSKSYRTISTDPIHFDVQKGSGKSMIGSGRNSKKELAGLKKMGNSKTELTGSDFAFSLLYWSLLIVIILGGYATIVLTKNRRIQLADVTGMKFKKAAKVAHKRLAKAEKIINGTNKNLFYDEMLNAIWGYFSDKLKLPLGELTRENIASRLSAYGYSSETTNEVTDLLDKLDFARYAPESSQKLYNEELYKIAIELISKIENLKTATL
ncbi:BatD family protein [Falsiporphyromonas endometrii]|uniref:BatD family protein n=1 Tax=Falsiporphyromonas endometrii TaxID=1387297 RepID=A0ABV9K967_9PORP